MIFNENKIRLELGSDIIQTVIVMARYRRYTKTIVKAPRKRWNLGHVIANTDPSAYNLSFINFSTVVVNDRDNSTPTPTVIKAKRIKCSGCLTVQAQVVQQTTPQPIVWTSVIIFMPQVVYRAIPDSGVAAQTGYLEQVLIDHPEWIMSKKNLNITWNGGQPSESTSYKWTQSTGKLSRNLKSGDRILWILSTRPLLASDNHWQQCTAEFDFATCTS